MERQTVTHLRQHKASSALATLALLVGVYL